MLWSLVASRKWSFNQGKIYIGNSLWGIRIGRSQQVLFKRSGRLHKFDGILIFVGSSDVRLTQPPSIFQLPPLQKDVSFVFVTKGALQSV